ncbi:hypothetical protein SODALDRAFT_110148 [Sodiomyces alkalinus F11]|uniref:Uncharacterized protein n=1 Tax=Sodiomyces alkalinus (strain CBS 110278 / VKM F-3762 / F11) TaxID=1314773 RepID=A0A3N2Q2Q2_SODAK|nr:hypothetical protein SODALDRAFT_110148 [Sodiomyces alkalinus F11]ROT41030.1 hypothetical protein SODALDRAFT_110148 [Sodiomyces alkalinus F11]
MNCTGTLGYSAVFQDRTEEWPKMKIQLNCIVPWCCQRHEGLASLIRRIRPSCLVHVMSLAATSVIRSINGLRVPRKREGFLEGFLGGPEEENAPLSPRKENKSKEKKRKEITLRSIKVKSWFIHACCQIPLSSNCHPIPPVFSYPTSPSPPRPSPISSPASVVRPCLSPDFTSSMNRAIGQEEQPYGCLPLPDPTPQLPLSRPSADHQLG